MDLKIQGRRALVCAASRGLGRACAEALAAEDVMVTITGRDPEQLARTADDIGKLTGRDVGIAAGDVTTPAGREAALAACPEPDILVTNAGGPPLGEFEALDDDAWRLAIEANMLAPLALIRAVHGGMRQRRFGRIINITSAYIKSPHPLLALSAGPRAGLTAAVSALARAGIADNVTINNLLPEMIQTDRARAGFGVLAEQADQTYEAYVTDFVADLPARRMGEPHEFGAACAFLCGADAGYITNQNLVIDGGHYAGVY